MLTNSLDSGAVQSLVAQGDELRKSGQLEQAVELYLTATKSMESPPPTICVKLARSYEQLGNRESACRWALAVVDVGNDFPSWQVASTVLQRCAVNGGTVFRRSVRVALTGSFTTMQLAQMLRLAAGRVGIEVEIYESPYGQYEQEIIDPRSVLGNVSRSTWTVA